MAVDTIETKTADVDVPNPETDDLGETTPEDLEEAVTGMADDDEDDGECYTEEQLASLAEAREALADRRREEAAQAKGDFRAVVNAKALAWGVALASKGVSGRSTQPVQNNVLLRTDAAGAVSLAATDLEFVQIEVLLPATEAGNGALTLPPRVLEPIARSLPKDADVALTGEATDTPARGRLFSSSGAVSGIAAARTRLNLRGMDARDFELLPPMPEDAVRFELPQGLLKQCLAQVRPAVCTDETRPTLTGVCLRVDRGMLEFAATDTRRLALREATIGEDAGSGEQYILSVALVAHLEALLNPTSEAPVQVALHEEQAEFAGLGPNGEVTLGTRVIEGQFPDWNKVVPDSCDKRLVVDSAQFVESLSRLMVVAREDAYRVSLTAEGGELILWAESPDVGDMAETVEATVEGGDVATAFNGSYLLDGLAGVKSEKVRLELGGPLNPGMIVDGDYRYVLMPMQK